MSLLKFNRSLFNLAALFSQPDYRPADGAGEKPITQVSFGFACPVERRKPTMPSQAPSIPAVCVPGPFEVTLPLHLSPPRPARAMALVHDYLAQAGGAERVVSVLHSLFPEAPLYTSVYDPKTTLPCFAAMDVRTSFLQGSVFSKRRFHKLALRLYPLAFEQFDLSEYGLVISSSSSFAKGVITGPETCHICYCHTPARFAWRPHEYLQQNRLTRLLEPWMRGMLSDLRRWDADSAQRVDFFVANSHNVAGRIRKYYRREVDAVIYPPVETRRFSPASAGEIGSHFLVVSRLVGYKRIDLAVEACSRLQIPLRVVGTGPALRSLKRLAGPTIEFLGRLSDEQVALEYARCQALIFPGEEDFGMTPVECMASGRPVVAFGRGGALETVAAGKTGIFFEAQTPESLMEALQSLSRMEIMPECIQAHAFQFDSTVFVERMQAFVEKTLINHQDQYRQKAEWESRAEKE